MMEKGDMPVPLCNTELCDMKFKMVTDAIANLAEQTKARFDGLERLVSNGITASIREHHDDLLLLKSERDARQSIMRRIWSAVITVTVGAAASGITWLLVSYSKTH